MKELVNKLKLLERKRDLLASSKSFVEDQFVKDKIDIEEYEIARSFFDFPEKKEKRIKKLNLEIAGIKSKIETMKKLKSDKFYCLF